MKIKQIVVGILLAPLSFAEPVWAENPQVNSVESPVVNKECELVEMPIPLEAEGNSLPTQMRSPACLNLAQLGDRAEQTEAILSQALEFAQTITNPAKKATVLAQIAVRYANLGEEFQADSVLFQAVEAVEAIEDASEKAAVLTAISINIANIKDPALVSDLLSEALELANTIDDAEVRGSLLTKIALVYSDIGTSDLSQDILSMLPSLEPEVVAAVSDSPLEPTPWQGNFLLSSQLFSGAKTASTVIVSSQLERQWSRDELKFGLSYLNSFDNSRVTPENDNQIRGEFSSEYRYHPSARQYYVVSSTTLKDELSDINLRSDLYLGSGLNLWRGGANQTLDMQLGLGVRYDDAVEQDSEVDFPVAEYKLSYEDIFFANLLFNQSLSFQLSLENTNDYIAEAASIISVPLSDRWSFNNGLQLIYEAEPAGDTTNLRLNLDTGIKYEF